MIVEFWDKYSLTSKLGIALAFTTENEMNALLDINTLEKNNGFQLFCGTLHILLTLSRSICLFNFVYVLPFPLFAL